MLFLFALFSDVPEVFLPEYSQTAIFHAAHFRRGVNIMKGRIAYYLCPGWFELTITCTQRETRQFCLICKPVYKNKYVLAQSGLYFPQFKGPLEVLKIYTERGELIFVVI